MGWHSELEPTKLRTRRCERFCLRFDLRDAMRWSGSATCHCSCTGYRSSPLLCCVLYLLQRAMGDKIRSIDKACKYGIVVGEWGEDESLPSHEAGSPNCQHNTSWLDATSCSLPSPLLVGLRMIPVAEPIKGH